MNWSLVWRSVALPGRSGNEANRRIGVIVIDPLVAAIAAELANLSDSASGRADGCSSSSNGPRSRWGYD